MFINLSRIMRMTEKNGNNDIDLGKTYFPRKANQLWSLGWQIELIQLDIQKEKSLLKHMEKKLSEIEEQYNELEKEIDNG